MVSPVAIKKKKEKKEPHYNEDLVFILTKSIIISKLQIHKMVENTHIYIYIYKETGNIKNRGNGQEGSSFTFCFVNCNIIIVKPA